MATRDEAFATFASRESRLLLGIAYLVWGDPARAGHLVESALAHCYRDWVTQRDNRGYALNQILTGRDFRSWKTGYGRFDLVDEPPRPGRPLILQDLAGLPVPQRQAVVLILGAGLSAAEVGDLLRVGAGQALRLARQGQAALTGSSSLRADPAVLARELADAVAVLDPPAADHLANGRALRRRDQVRTGIGAVAAVVVLVLTIGALIGPARIAERGAPTPAPVATSTRPAGQRSCGPADVSCRTSTTLVWRLKVARVVSSYLDTDETYFSGFTYSAGPDYDSDALWAGQGGALGLDMYRLQAGATQVFVQIASGPEFAVRCGKRTGLTCVSMQSMSGNRFSTTQTSTAAEGIEVQYSPDGVQVITVVARQVSAGETLDITRGQLLSLVQDDELRLPQT